MDRGCLLGAAALLGLLGAAGAQDAKDLKPGAKPIAVRTPSRKEPVSYANELADVLAEKCVGCHGAALAESKLSLEDVPAMLTGGRRGPALVPGKAAESLLFRMAAHQVAPEMPPKDKPGNVPMSPDELGLLKLWIDAGAQDDSADPPGGARPEGAKAVALGPLPPGVHPILAVDVTADGARVAAGRANVVQVYDVDSGREIASLGGHKDLIQSVRFSPDGSMLAAGSYQIVTIWKVPPRAPAKTPAPADGAPGAETSAGSWGEPRVFAPHADRVLALDFSPDGRLLAAGGGDPSRSGELKLWDVAKGEPVRVLDSLHADTIFAVKFSPDGKRLASASADRFLKVSAVPDGKELRSFEGHTHHVTAVDWKADGTQVVTGGADKVLKLWDVETEEQIRTLPEVGKQVTAVCWIQGKPEVVAASGDAQVRIWNPDNERVVRVLAGPSDFIYCVAASADGSRVAAGGDDGVLFLWDGRTGKLLRKIGPKPAAGTASR